jgi:arabinofuranosyltransferase
MILCRPCTRLTKVRFQRVILSSFQRLRILGATIAAAFYALFIYRTSFNVTFANGETKRVFVLFEDAMISMRYARNFERGAGLNWNAGEERVEGYTNLLWTLWMSLVHKFHLDETLVSLPIMVGGALCVLSLAWVTRRIALHLGASEGGATASYLGVLFCYPLVFWSLRGMEVGAISLALHGVVLLALELEESFGIGKVIGMGLVGAAAVLLRSDAAVTIGIVCAYAALMQPKRRALMLAGALGPVVLAVLGHTIFRRVYYHETLPNTAYLKLANIPVLARLKRGLFVALRVCGYHLGVPISIMLASLVSNPRPQGDRAGWASAFQDDDFFRRRVLIGVLLSVQASYAVYVGGDAWEWMLYANRYTSAALPAFIALVPALFESVASVEKLGRRLGVFLVLAGVVTLGVDVFARLYPEFGVARTIFSSKKVMAGGGLLIVLGVAALVRRVPLVYGLAKLKSGLSGSPRMAALFLVVAFLPAQAEPVAIWLRNNAAQYTDEAEYARLGLLIARTTPKDYRIAVVAAGATPYFADRPTEDMLGKNDKVIAKQAPKGVFAPGHDKWDYAHSLGEKQPDMVVEFADVRDSERALISQLGYVVEGANGLYVKVPPVRAAKAALWMKWRTEAELTAALRAAELPPPPMKEIPKAPEPADSAVEAPAPVPTQ